MNLVLWIGARHPPPEARQLVSAVGAQVAAFPTIDSALAATVGLPVAAAVFAADAGDPAPGIQKLLHQHPGVQVLAATDQPLPPGVVAALRAGASAVLDLRGLAKSEISEALKEALARHDRFARERGLLLRLRGLNEEFLKSIVSAQKRNLELEEEQKPLAEKLAASIDEGPARVLVVDDEEVIRQVVSAVLKKRGYECVAASSAEEALEVFAQHRFHLLLTDKNLPGLSGVDLMKKVKELSPETDVVMMTGYANKESAMEAVNLGAAGYLEKPFEHITHVAEKVAQVLSQQKDQLRKRQYLAVIRERNREFLDQYRLIRSDLETWLSSQGKPKG